MRPHRIHRVLENLDNVPVEPGSTSIPNPGIHCGTSRTPTGEPAADQYSSTPARRRPPP
ncbi:hypothetical protein [Streptomyces syringium]|uniref:hypothetical protein n=1 Tax=Streptomyces syringium TaxID=76729 RepID=UPI003452C09A